ncbi:centrosome-associated protein 350 [Xyrauchen texanus]|uniref:centrosome-associated protein 350 n=1 Tax=Xyrauchen texanus TaxID=154827 RepID=UPI0022425B6D|nr:centrosome-associated protein 350 [Xyrauchen texanus]
MPVMNRSGLLSKAGLRRLFSSDEVWSLGSKRNQVELVPAEQHILQISESNHLPASRSHRFSRQNQAPVHLISPERTAKTDSGNTQCQQDSVKTLKSGSKSDELETHKKVQGFYEDVCTPKNNEACDGEILQHPAEGPLKQLLNIQQLTLSHEFDPDAEKNPIESNLSSDTKEVLLFDSKSGRFKPKEQESVKKTSVVHSSLKPEINPLNVQSNQKLQSVLSLNNNLSDKNAQGAWKSSISYPKTDQIFIDHEFPEQKTQTSLNETITDNPHIESLILEAVSPDLRQTQDSLSCDGSLSEIDEKSEEISFHSEALAWSEEERDYLSEEKNEASTCSLVFAEKFTVIPDNFQHKLYLNNKPAEGCNTSPCYERKTTVESTLSEILSPVDEVLSYSSAELPPSVKGGAGTGLDSYSYPPPPPAFEIITWTSEEEQPAPPDCVEDLSINSENIPPLPVDLYQRRIESQCLASNSLRPKKENNDDTNGDCCKTLPLTQSIYEDIESDCSLPEDRNEISDPLSSFQFGDRVLVCKSRPGVLKYKGLAAFADGFWAGVALDTPNGNHNGTFRGVKYFSCDKSHGVLVRAEDISRIHREHGIETGVDEDPFSDEDPPSAQKDTSSTCGQGGHKHFQCPPRDDSKMPKNSLQNEPHRDMFDGARDLSHPLEMPSPKIGYERSVGENMDHVNDSNHSVAKLTQVLGKDVVHYTQDTRKTPRHRMKLVHDYKSIDTDIRKSEVCYFMPCLLEQWHPAQPDLPPKIKVPPHEDGIVYRLVDATVDILCGQANYDSLDSYETPSYLLDDDSRKSYRQVIFQLTSDVLHEVLGDLLRTKQSAKNIDDDSLILALQSRKISVTFLKATVRKNIQKILYLDRSEQQMKEMLQKLCKYWNAKRDRVDYILIQELHNEERTWLDYRSDQDTVKMHLTEEIFSLLLDDTILALNHMHV